MILTYIVLNNSNSMTQTEIVSNTQIIFKLWVLHLLS